MMKHMLTIHRRLLLIGLAALGATCPSMTHAATDIDISAYYNASWSIEFGGDSIVAAPTDGSTGTGITFADWNGNYVNVGFDQGGHASPFTIPSTAALPTNPCVNALFNLFYGVTGQVNATIVFANDQGATASYSLVGDQTVRDYNTNEFTNDLQGYDPDPTSGEVFTQPWWQNYSGTVAFNNGQRLDVATFVLPTSWAGTNLVSMTITNPYEDSVTTDDVILSALQTDSVPPSALPVVTVSVAGSGTAVPGGPAGKFVVERTGNTGLPLTVLYKAKGSAKGGVDYKALSGSVTFPVGASRVKIKVKPFVGAPDPGPLKVKLALKPAIDGSYNTGSAVKAKITVAAGE